MTSGVYERSPFIPEHRAAMSKAHTGVSLTSEHCNAISTGKLGITISPRTPEHCAAISKGREDSEAAKDAYESMRGGDDIVKHHFIYDHDNPDQHTVEITRSEHQTHHHWMKRNGLEVPHVNVTEDNKDIFK